MGAANPVASGHTGYRPPSVNHGRCELGHGCRALEELFYWICAPRSEQRPRFFAGRLRYNNCASTSMKESLKYKNALATVCGLALVISGSVVRSAGSRRTQKQPIYANIVNGLFCGTSNVNQCKVSAGQRLIIAYVPGFTFAPVSSNQITSVTMAVTDQGLGLNGAGFHVFRATKVNITSTTDVFAFSVPMKMMLHPKPLFSSRAWPVFRFRAIW